jgi:hypothetical protein
MHDQPNGDVPLFLDRRLEKPNFKLIKPFTTEFANVGKQLTHNEYNNHIKIEKDKNPLDPRSSCPAL